MKKTIAAVLSAAIFALTASAASANAPAVTSAPEVSARSEYSAVSETAADERLKKVTLSVKETLGIGDDYTKFDGYMTERASNVFYWDLSWSKDDGSLYVTADENGKIFRYSHYSDGDYNYKYDPYFAPVFPGSETELAKTKADEFLAKVLTQGESAELTVSNFNPVARTQSECYLYGTLKINGLDSPFNISMTVNLSDMRIMQFTRSDDYIIPKNPPPAPNPTVTQSEAKNSLKSIFELEAVYIASPDNQNEAIVAYVPRHSLYDQVVDAKTGKLVTVSGVAMPMNAESAAYGGSAMDEKGSTQLSQYELEGIAKLEGIMSKEELDAVIRNLKVLGVTSDYEIARFDVSSYDADNGETTVTANIAYRANFKDVTALGVSAGMRYTPESSEVYKDFSVDAKTGLIKKCNTYYYGIYGDHSTSDAPAIRDDVSAFLASNFSDIIGETELYKSSRTEYGFISDSYTFARKINGYFYPDNYVQVTINSKTGYIDSLYMYWNPDMNFKNPSGVINTYNALAVYADSLNYPLVYELYSTPEKNDNYTTPEIILAYKPVFDGIIYGIDASSGELLHVSRTDDVPKPVYDDISGTNAKDKIEKLAEYRVGFYSSSFKPNEKLSEKDMLLLLVSANGNVFEPDSLSDPSVLVSLYGVAYNLGIIDRGAKNPDNSITRAEFAKTLVYMSGYGKAANLPGIYTCGYADDSDIPAEMYGYIAIAKGLGVIEETSSFRPNSPITRQEAAVMLYNFMSRAK